MFVICLSFSLAQTYNILGRVLDSETKIPISNVNIFIINTNIGTTTDTEGNFNFLWDEQVKDSSKLNIKMMGYKELIIPLDVSKIKKCLGCLSSQIDLGEILITTQLLELESIHIHSHKHKSNQISDISLSGQQLDDNLSGNIASTSYPLELANQNNNNTKSSSSVSTTVAADIPIDEDDSGQEPKEFRIKFKDSDGAEKVLIIKYN